MSAKKPSKSLSRYNPNLIARIDSMDDDSEYNPYSANKRQTITESELFDNKDYLDEEEAQEEMANKSKPGSSGAILVVLLTLMIVGVVGMLLVIAMKYIV